MGAPEGNVLDVDGDNGDMPVARRPYGGVSAEDRVAARRTRLLEATLAIIGEHGVAAVTVDLICSEAQLGKRYFYESFTDRDTLLVARAAVSASHVSADDERLEPVFTELIAAHTRRMDALGLTA